jgi:hemoglobin
LTTVLPDLDDRDRITQFVRDFYRQVAMDDLLGPVFARAHVDWAAHIPKLVDFWSWQLLGAPRYERNPLRAHEPVHARDPFEPELYERWLELFDATVDDSFYGAVADLAKDRARRMAHALQRLLDGVSAPGSEPGVVTALPTTRSGSAAVPRAGTGCPRAG